MTFQQICSMYTKVNTFCSDVFLFSLTAWDITFDRHTYIAFEIFQAQLLHRCTVNVLSGKSEKFVSLRKCPQTQTAKTPADKNLDAVRGEKDDRDRQIFSAALQHEALKKRGQPTSTSTLNFDSTTVNSGQYTLISSDTWGKHERPGWHHEN